jgi:hypothetical protein
MWKIAVLTALVVVLFSGCAASSMSGRGDDGHIYDAAEYEAFVDFSDSLGAHGFYDSKEYERLERFNDATDPLHLYDY